MTVITWSRKQILFHGYVLSPGSRKELRNITQPPFPSCLFFDLRPRGTPIHLYLPSEFLHEFQGSPWRSRNRGTQAQSPNKVASLTRGLVPPLGGEHEPTSDSASKQRRTSSSAPHPESAVGVLREQRPVLL